MHTHAQAMMRGRWARLMVAGSWAELTRARNAREFALRYPTAAPLGLGAPEAPWSSGALGADVYGTGGYGADGYGAGSPVAPRGSASGAALAVGRSPSFRPAVASGDTGATAASVGGPGVGGFQRLYDDSAQAWYWYNAATGEASWTDPSA